MQHVGEVGRAELLEGREEVLGALPVLLQREPGDRRPLHGQSLALVPPERPALALADEHPVDLPVPAGRQLLHRDVEDRHLLARLHELYPAVQQFPDDEALGGALLEPAHVHDTGGDDLARLDAGDSGHGQEDPAAGGQFDDQTEQSRRFPAHPQDGHQVADAAHLVAVRVEDGDAGEVGDEDPGRHRRHEPPLSFPSRGDCPPRTASG